VRDDDSDDDDDISDNGNDDHDNYYGFDEVTHDWYCCFCCSLIIYDVGRRMCSHATTPASGISLINSIIT